MQGGKEERARCIVWLLLEPMKVTRRKVKVLQRQMCNMFYSSKMCMYPGMYDKIKK